MTEIKSKTRGRPKTDSAKSLADRQRVFREKQKTKALRQIDYAVYRQFMDAAIKEREAFYYVAQADEKDARMNELNVLVLFDIRFEAYLKTVKQPTQ